MRAGSLRWRRGLAGFLGVSEGRGVLDEGDDGLCSERSAYKLLVWVLSAESVDDLGLIELDYCQHFRY